MEAPCHRCNVKGSDWRSLPFIWTSIGLETTTISTQDSDRLYDMFQEGCACLDSSTRSSIFTEVSNPWWNAVLVGAHPWRIAEDCVAHICYAVKYTDKNNQDIGLHLQTVVSCVALGATTFTSVNCINSWCSRCSSWVWGIWWKWCSSQSKRTCKWWCWWWWSRSSDLWIISSYLCPLASIDFKVYEQKR